MVIRAYHGSPFNGLDEIRAGSGGKYQRVAGVYFTTDRKEAEKYTKIKGVKHPENIYTVDLHLERPAKRSVLDKIGYGLDGVEMQEKLIDMGYDSVVDEFMGEIIAFYPDQVKLVRGNPKRRG